MYSSHTPGPEYEAESTFIGINSALENNLQQAAAACICAVVLQLVVFVCKTPSRCWQHLVLWARKCKHAHAMNGDVLVSDHFSSPIALHRPSFSFCFAYKFRPTRRRWCNRRFLQWWAWGPNKKWEDAKREPFRLRTKDACRYQLHSLATQCTTLYHTTKTLPLIPIVA